MRFTRRALAIVLSYALGVQPVVAQVQGVRLSVPAAAAGAAAAAALGGSSAEPIQLQALDLPLALPAPAPTIDALAPKAPDASAAASAALPPAERVSLIHAASDKAVDGIGRASSDGASSQAAGQFAALTGERLASSDGDAAAGAPVSAAATAESHLQPATAPTEAAAKDEPPAPKLGTLQIFRDPARNRDFRWYALGFAIFSLGYEMYGVAKPYMISALTTNSLLAHGSPRARSADGIAASVRYNRALTSIAHWVAQAVSYFAIPLFSRNAAKEGPRKWLVLSMFVRAAALAAVPALFFATGALSIHASLGIFAGLVVAQSFFQGVTVTMENVATLSFFTGVADDERTKANSIISGIENVLAIPGQLAAGCLARMRPVRNKAGVGGAVIYGIYAVAAVLSALIYTFFVKIFREKNKSAAVSAAPDAAPESIGATLRSLWRSIRDGVRIMWGDSMLRTVSLISMMGALFSEPLIANVLPDYVKSLATQSPGALAVVMRVPGLGWLLQTLMQTDLGSFALVSISISLGGLAPLLLMPALTRLFQKVGFKTEAALSIPFYFIAALEAPLFFVMIHTHSLLGVALLFGLQSLVVGFSGINVTGLTQSNMQDRQEEDVNKIYAAGSLLTTMVTCLSTLMYGVFLSAFLAYLTKHPAVHLTNAMVNTIFMWGATAATAAISLVRLAAPFLSFTKAQMFPPAAPPDQPPSAGPAHAPKLPMLQHGPHSAHPRQL